MGFMDSVKKGAKMFMFSGKPKSVNSKLSVYPSAQDLNENKIPDMLEQRPSPLRQPKPQPQLKDISRNKHGHYVSTITYPLPPVSWEKKEFDKNKKMRNGGNKYL